MQGLDFSVVTPYTDILLLGVWWTVVLTVTGAVISFFFGIFFAVAVLYAPKVIAYPIRFFMWLFMGTPLLLQLFLIYFGLAQIGINVPALAAGIIGLGLHFAVYNADVMRAGIVSVDVGQTEGARSIGFGPVPDAALRRHSASRAQHPALHREQSDRAFEGIVAGLDHRHCRTRALGAAGDQRNVPAIRILHHGGRTLLHTQSRP